MTDHFVLEKYLLIASNNLLTDPPAVPPQPSEDTGKGFLMKHKEH